MAHEKVEELLRAALQGGDGLAGLRTIAQTLSTLLAPPPLVFAIPGYERMARELVANSNGRLKLGQDERKTHKDGNGWHRFISDVHKRHVIIVGGTPTNNDWMELYQMSYNAAEWEAEKLTTFLVYHGKARQERAQKRGESIDGLYATMMLAHIPIEWHKIWMVDIHAEAITAFLKGAGCKAENIEALTALVDKLIVDVYQGDCALAAPDAGRGKVVQKLAKARRLRYAIASKDRSDEGVDHSGLIGDVAGMNVILSDDMAVSCDSAIGAGKLIRVGSVPTADQILEAGTDLKDRGAKDIILACTHPVLPINPKTGRNYLYDLRDSGIFSGFWVYDTIPHIYELQAEFEGFLHVQPLAPLAVPYLLA